MIFFFYRVHFRTILVMQLFSPVQSEKEFLDFQKKNILSPTFQVRQRKAEIPIEKVFQQFFIC
jgi:hypothetical protein